jgi:hypothetical protein
MSPFFYTRLTPFSACLRCFLLRPRRWKRVRSPKHQWASTGLYGFKSQKIVLFVALIPFELKLNLFNLAHAGRSYYKRTSRTKAPAAAIEASGRGGTIWIQTPWDKLPPRGQLTLLWDMWERRAQVRQVRASRFHRRRFPCESRECDVLISSLAYSSSSKMESTRSSETSI